MSHTRSAAKKDPNEETEPIRIGQQLTRQLLLGAKSHRSGKEKKGKPMKKTVTAILFAGIASASIALAPMAHADSCDADIAWQTRHNAADPGGGASEAVVAAYNREADAIDAAIAVDCH